MPTKYNPNHANDSIIIMTSIWSEDTNWNKNNQQLHTPLNDGKLNLKHGPLKFHVQRKLTLLSSSDYCIPQAEQIQAEYKVLALQFHPDKNPDKDAEAKFQKLKVRMKGRSFHHNCMSNLSGLPEFHKITIAGNDELIKTSYRVVT